MQRVFVLQKQKHILTASPEWSCLPYRLEGILEKNKKHEISHHVNLYISVSLEGGFRMRECLCFNKNI